MHTIVDLIGVIVCCELLEGVMGYWVILGHLHLYPTSSKLARVFWKAFFLSVDVLPFTVIFD